MSFNGIIIFFLFLVFDDRINWFILNHWYWMLKSLTTSWQCILLNLWKWCRFYSCFLRYFYRWNWNLTFILSFLSTFWVTKNVSNGIFSGDEYIPTLIWRNSFRLGTISWNGGLSAMLLILSDSSVNLWCISNFFLLLTFILSHQTSSLQSWRFNTLRHC